MKANFRMTLTKLGWTRICLWRELRPLDRQCLVSLLLVYLNRLCSLIDLNGIFEHMFDLHPQILLIIILLNLIIKRKYYKHKIQLYDQIMCFIRFIAGKTFAHFLLIGASTNTIINLVKKLYFSNEIEVKNTIIYSYY